MSHVPDQEPMFGLTRAPEIALQGACWFNVEYPLKLASLKGRLVILDFWTFCCINCLHVIPTLKRLEQAFPQEIAVIGVHSPKFSAEKDAGKVAHAIARYDVRHPVVHDPEFLLWEQYAVSAWPTLVLIGPDGRVLGDISGEPDPDKLFDGISNMVENWRQTGRLTPSSLPLAIEKRKGGKLRFPGKIKPLSSGPLTEEAGAPLWIVADAGHHQIAILNQAGEELRRFGSGEAGFLDGAAEDAQFRRPEGITADATAIYVADTGNHRIRRIDQATGEVTTLAGTGARGVGLCEPEPALETPLASPWDLAIDGNQLYFANAGSHQLGRLHLTDQTVAVLAGSTNEHIGDGPGMEANLAQPSGLALDAKGRNLYFVDAETSSVRVCRLDRDGWIDTLVGTGLFDFGDADGPFDKAQLQHPLGLTFGPDGMIYVADSYNGKVRVLDLEKKQVRNLPPLICGNGGQGTLSEPAGIACADEGRLLVTDTNNHRILMLDCRTGAVEKWYA